MLESFQAKTEPNIYPLINKQTTKKAYFKHSQIETDQKFGGKSNLSKTLSDDGYISLKGDINFERAGNLQRNPYTQLTIPVDLKAHY